MMNQQEQQKYVSGWLKRKKEKEKQLEERHKLAMEKVVQISHILKNKYQINRVILFGSLAENKFYEHSDIDLAVFGLNENNYLDVAEKACQIALPFKLDLIPIERASESLKRRIKLEGVDL